jgi:putative endonuclease
MGILGPMYFVYMLKNSKGRLYIGITKNLHDRLRYHNAHQGAQFTKSKDLFFVVFSEMYSTLLQARKREVQIKKWRRDKKETLIDRFISGLPTK